MSKHATRGSALPETALVLTATLAMVFGMIQIGIIGFLQVMCDGAAFIAAHEYSLGNASYAQFAARPFPLMGTPLVDPNPPDVASSPIPVTYNGEAATAREGGVSIIMPNHWQATVKIASSAVLGSGLGALSSITLHGSAVEPSFLVSNNAYDIGGAGYAGNAAGVPFFSSTQQENTPDYYVSSHRLLICTAAAGWSTCPAANQKLLSLGTAEFLDVDNWARTSSSTSSAGVGPGTSYTFAEVYCHVNAYVTAASTFVAATSNQGYSGGMPSASSMTQATSQIYSWDQKFSNGASSLETPDEYPLTPDAGC